MEQLTKKEHQNSHANTEKKLIEIERRIRGKDSGTQAKMLILEVRNPKGYETIKRVFDLVFALLAIVLTLPIMVLVAIAIKLDSPGPLVFSQTRIGQNRRIVQQHEDFDLQRRQEDRKGRPIQMYKFRTMSTDSDPYAISPKSTGDRRITRVGKILRPLCLDELPQLFSVLLGDMSLVGPRPEMAFIVKDYTLIEAQRLLVKPGVTGLWQLNGSREKAIHEDLIHDFTYITNRSLMLDFKILVQTVLFMVSFKNS